MNTVIKIEAFLQITFILEIFNIFYLAKPYL